MSCEQCGAEISKSLASSLVDQLDKLKRHVEGEPRLICVGCFFSNDRAFHPEDDEPPLSSSVREELAHKPEIDDKSTDTSKIVAITPSGKLPTDLRKRVRYDLSKRGRLGRPPSAKLNGEHVYECPLCGEPCPRTRVSGRSLDDVVIHLLDSREYIDWEAKI